MTKEELIKDKEVEIFIEKIKNLDREKKNEIANLFFRINMDINRIEYLLQKTELDNHSLYLTKKRKCFSLWQETFYLELIFRDYEE